MGKPKIDISGQTFGYFTAIEYRGGGKWLFRCKCGNERVIGAFAVTSGRRQSCGCLHKDKIRDRENEIVGKKFGSLTVLKHLGYGRWLFQCDCGKTIEHNLHRVRTGIIKSCGCVGAKAFIKDISGERFGKLTAIKYVGERKWLCQCDCGKEKVIPSGNLVQGHTTSCGCNQVLNSIKYKGGQRFGSVVLTERLTKGLWKFRCDCGKEFVSHPYPYKIGKNRTCGCSLYDGSRQTTHDMSRTNIYHIWLGMKRRCNNPNFNGYENYGGRGIKVCERWNKSFENFYADMGDRPSTNHSLDRIDVNGDYEPSNCRWATNKEQANNKRNNIIIEHEGSMRTISEWCEIYGIPKRTAHNRYRSGYPFEKIFSKKQVTRKLTDEEVRAVRVDNLTALPFQERFGKKVSNSLLEKVKNYEAYTDVI